MLISISKALVAHWREAASNDVLRPVEDAVERVFEHYGHHTELSDVPRQERDTLGVAQYLQSRLLSFRETNNCPNCWLPAEHCICSQCPPISYKPSKLNRIFLLMHYKELLMKVDTSKLIWACYPETCRLVVSGIGSEFQPAMAELQAAIDSKNCLVLFPTDVARPFSEIEQNLPYEEGGLDVIVMDGTWPQARRMHKRYIASEEDGGPLQAKLSDDAVAMLEDGEADGQMNRGHQLRKHSITWRKVGTFEATRLFLRDLAGSDGNLAWNDQMQKYQQIANLAAVEDKYGKQNYL